MKVTKHKKSRKYISFYVNNFGFREPLLVLIDGTFAHTAYKSRLQIADQLKKYFQREVKPIVTACIITETERIGPQLTGVCQLLKQFQVHRCGHEKDPIAGSVCIKAMTKTCHYVVATQDRKLQDWTKTKPGIPLFYLHGDSVPTLVQPSEVSVRAAAQHQQNYADVRQLDEQTLAGLKKREGIAPQDDSQRVKKRRKPKNPNPLSCKKKSKKPKGEQPIRGVKEDGGVQPTRRKRVKLPKHVLEQLKANSQGKIAVS